jgi:hypothetical protein
VKKFMHESMEQDAAVVQTRRGYRNSQLPCVYLSQLTKNQLPASMRCAFMFTQSRYNGYFPY